MIPFSPLHKKYLAVLGTGILLALGTWVLWHGARFLVDVVRWQIAFTQQVLWPLRFHRSVLYGGLQLLTLATFLLAWSIPVVGVWHLVRWWRTGGPWCPPAPPRRQNPYQVFSREEHAGIQRALDTHRPR